VDPEESPGPVADDSSGGAGGSGSKGVVLAVAIVLLWLAGVCLYVAFEGTSFLPEQLPAGPGGKPSYFLGIIQAVTRQTQQLQQQGEPQTDNNSGG
jgi:hypothetical protein